MAHAVVQWTASVKHSETGIVHGTLYTTELKKMEADNYTLWKIAFFHEPIFNSMPDRPDQGDLKTTWYPLFEQYHLDIMFVGHNHYYERTYPINHTGEFDNSQDPNYINQQLIPLFP